MNGLPSFSMIFIELAATAIARSARGIVGIIMKDDTDQSFNKKAYYSAADVKEVEWGEKNYKILKRLVFKGAPFKVLVYRLNEDATDLKPALEYFKRAEPNYMAYPGGTTLEHADLVSWLKSIRNEQSIRKSTIKLITVDQDADHEAVIEMPSVQNRFVVEGETFNAFEYTACHAGCAAGVPLNSSLTYYKHPWIDDMDLIDESAGKSVEDYIKEGKLVIDYDGKNYKVMRGVTSFVTPSDTKNRSFSKIRLMEIMDLNMKDIRETYDDYYLGKYQNFYGNKKLFMGAVNAYLGTFKEGGQLDPAHANKMDVDLAAHKTFLLEQGEDEEYVNGLSEYQLRRVNTADKLFANIKDYKPTDVMEDCVIKAYL